MMPAGTVHTVLCARCRKPAVTTVAYPERACGVTGWAGRVMVSCTLTPSTCPGHWHLDLVANTMFIARAAPLGRRRYGETGRA
jgi:hypothetical protein